MRILLVEDSQRLRRTMTEGLRREGFSVDTAAEGNEALQQALEQPYDLIVLDLMLPGLDGLSILQKLREAGNAAHVLVLTARAAVEDRVRGLELGADDYLVKPFAFEELVARIRALGRRSYQRKNPVVELAGLRVNVSNRTVEREGESIELTRKEYALLEYLLHNRGVVVSRDQIEAHIYDDRVDPTSNVVDVLVCNLRRKIDRPGAPSVVQTRRGMGYLVAEEPA
ncbi:MAG: response regulator transcription factor [Candidatus Sumerlaeia bacterium]|nr:response regulator transcription factor [Candidatus Sumerlaeia bacterium]